MLPDKALIIKCPHCGGEKPVMNLLSGNTCGAVYWSDNKMVAPMLPELSFVQKCPQCGKYYVLHEERISGEGDDWSFDLGTLTFVELKEAFGQLSSEGFSNTAEEAQVRFLLHHSYNDCFYREPTQLTPDDNDKLLFKQNALWLIENSIADDVMRAEFYREIGEMDISRKIIEETFPTDDILKYIKNEIVRRIEQNDNAVFKLSDDE